MPNELPDVGFLRLRQIIGDPRAKPPIPAIIPVSKSSWWEGVRAGRYPRAIKLSKRTTVWRVEDIRSLIERASASAGRRSSDPPHRVSVLP